MTVVRAGLFYTIYFTVKYFCVWLRLDFGSAKASIPSSTRGST